MEFMRQQYLVIALFLVSILLSTPGYSETFTEIEALEVIDRIIDPVDISYTESLNLLTDIESQLPQFSEATQKKFYRLWCWYQYLEELEEYVDYASEQLKWAEKDNNLSAMADLHNCRAYYKYLLDQYDEPLAELEQALELAQRANDAQVIADIYASRGEIYSYFGEVARSLFEFKMAAKNYELAENEYSKGYTLTEVSRALRRMHAYDDAEAYLIQLIERYQEVGDSISEAGIAIDYGLLYLDKGDPSKALQWFDRSILLIDQEMEAQELHIDERIDATGYYHKAEALARLGLADDAEKALKKSLEIYPEKDAIPMPAYTSMVKAAIENARNNSLQAINLAQHAVDQYTAQENDRMLIYAMDELVNAYATSGNYQSAYESTVLRDDIKNRLKTEINEQYSLRLKIEYDLAIKESENQALWFENRNKQLEIENNLRMQKWQSIVIALSILLFVLMANRIYIYIRNARTLQRLAMTDPLTDLPNRRAIESYSEELYTRANKQAMSISLIAFDIDHFKNINDTYGHDVGDLVIKQIAYLAKKCLREQDMLSRYGGEEYLAILPGTDLTHAIQVAERVCQSINSGSLNYIKEDLRVSVSVGVAERLLNELNPASTIRRADTALYDAKNSGRNQVKVAQ